MSGRGALWVRWSWRDLRRRKGLVVAIALIIAIGTGSYAGLGATSAWRLASNDASYAALEMHDLHVTLATGVTAPQGSLLSLIRGIPHAGDVRVAEERLIEDVQVDASRPGKTILVPGRMVGADAAEVDKLWVAAGRPGVLLEKKFADENGLHDAGTIRLSGGRRVSYTGTGMSPEYFMVSGGQSLVLASQFAVLFVPLARAQALAGRAGVVNDAVVRLRPGADAGAVQRELEAAAAGVGGTVTTRDDDPAYRALYEDARGDREFWDLFAVLILLGASFAAFNLVSRIVESERREIGVGMALGAPRATLAIRHLLVGAQVAFVGAAAGIGVGVLVGGWMRSFMTGFLPLPEWRTPFQYGRYAAAAALGVALPLAATALPVWRALRVQPVDAIRSGAYAGAGTRTGLAPLLRHLPMPGRIFRQLPFRNVLRAPRRTLLTALGVAASITSLVTVLGALDSFFAVIDRSEQELTREAPDRLSVGLDWFRATGGPEVARVAADPSVARVEPSLRLAGTLKAGGEKIDVVPTLLDLKTAIWRPSLVDPVGDVTKGIVLSEKAARDLGVRPGDTIVLRHPYREGTGYRLVDSRLTVTALHPLPLRFLVYLDASQASRFNLAGITNALVVTPAPGRTAEQVERSLFGLTGVSSVQPIADITTEIRDMIRDYLGILRIAEAAVLALAVLIAFNSASITVDERAREEATMFAYGLRVRAVLGMLTTETVLMGILGTAIGIGGGFLVLRWMITVLLPRTMPELGMSVVLSPSTMATTMVLGVLAVALAPLSMTRRLRNMDIPSTLRVLE